MLSRLHTVKAKLTALVALSIVVMLAALPILSWLLHRQMLDEVDNRVVDAQKSFGAELNDDLTDVRLAAVLLAKDETTRLGARTGDAALAGRMAGYMVGAYPTVDLLIFDGAGNLLVQKGVDSPPAHREQLSGGGAHTGEANESTRLVLRERGCETSKDAAPAAVVSLPLVGEPSQNEEGTVVVCMPLDDDYVSNTALKLGVGVALAHAGQRLAKSKDFPAGGLAAVRGDSSLADIGPKTWALAQFDVPQLPGLSAVMALDVTDVQAIIRRNLGLALLVLLFAATISVAFGQRLASLMSRALGRVNVALKLVAKQEYAHVDAIRTGDELDDLAAGFNTMIDGLKERDHLKTTMGKYMSPDVMEAVLAGKFHLGGETLPVTILFSDIRGFTTISENMKAHEVVSLLNEYFTEMVGVVMENGGVVDKYIGDAIMAVFGAPLPKPDDAIHAVRAAVRMRQALAKLNVLLVARGMPPLRTGIGIHTGEVVVGNIGSEKRMEYTVIGDAVNLASRLETSTKELGVHVLISDDTWKLVKDAVVTKPVKEITVKGRAAPVMTHAVLGIVGEDVFGD